MTRIAILLLSFIVFTGKVYSQNSFTIRGEVVDENGGQVTVGDVLLFDEGTEQLRSFTLINEGVFVLSDVPEGSYELRATCLGFKTYEQSIILKKDLFLSIELVESTTELEGAEVTAAKKLFSFERGNLKVDVTHPSLSSVPAPLDLLTRLPGVQLSTDQETVTLIGKGVPLIYLGNQRITLDEFKNLAIEDLQSIEIINNPSARYEAEGRAVLQIIRKSKRKNGSRLTISETASQKRNFSNYLSTSASITEGKSTIKTNLGYNELQTWESNSFDFQIPERDISTNYLVLIPRNDRRQFIVGGGYFFQLNSKDFLSLNANFRRQTDLFPIETETFLDEGGLENQIDTQTSNDYNRDFFSGTLNYSDEIAPALTLFTGFQYTSFDQGLITDIENNFNNTEFLPSQARRQEYNIQSQAYRLDIEKEFKNSHKVEFGLTINRAKAKASTLIEDFDLNSTTDIGYDYDEKTYSSYAQISGELKNKFGYTAGLRLENNLAKGSFSNEDELLIDRKRLNLFPRVTMNVTLDSTKNITLNYSKSITRPNFRNTSTITAFINPFLEGSNNVNLLPTLTDEWSCNFQWKSKTITLNYSRRKNPVFYSIQYDEIADRAVLSPNNFERESGFDISLGLPFSHKFWNATNWLSIYYRKVVDPSAVLGRTTPYVYAYTNHQFSLGKDSTLSIGGWTLTRRREGIFKRNALLVLEAAITKTFFEKLQCSLRFNDITRGSNFEESYEIGGISAEGVFFGDIRELVLVVRYSFGTKKAKDYKNKEIDENIDRIQ